ncbi:potassium-transporting ATPase subunit C [Belnapia moabensis]|uniref:potassium-transporting ATPase subunit C n=1 Tax=Belnapia moabensis TaxID=365533 RepID=UPI001FDFF5BA|nr:potassium-transporting ATPase subunit C [Belnapia moabensis]
MPDRPPQTLKERMTAGGPGPTDAVTASASGLDPCISPRHAARQAGRVAATRGVAPERARMLVARHAEGRK